MYPVLLQLGQFTISALWVFLAFGFFAALLILNKLIQKDRAKLTFMAEHSLVIFFGGLLMARLVFVIRNYPYFFNLENINQFFQIFFIWDKGLSIWGGLIGAIATLCYFASKKKENIWKWLDIMMISIMGGFVFAHIGAFLDGRNYGRETNLPWGVIIENSRYAVPIHPVQVYAAICTLLLTILLYQLFFHPRFKKAGDVALFGVGAYAILRFLEEFLRGDESNYLFWLREAQIYCIFAFLGSIILWYIRNKKATGSNSKSQAPNTPA